MYRHTRWRRSLAVLAATGTVCLVAGPVRADPAPPYATLISRNDGTSPRIAEASANVAEAGGLARQATFRPNPTLSVEAENFAGGRPFRGLEGVEITASIEQPLELGGRRRARIAVGNAGVSVAQSRARQTVTTYMFDLAEAYASAEGAEARVTLARDELAFALEDQRIASLLVQAGHEAELRSLQAQSAALSARASLDEAIAVRDAAFARLTAVAALPAPVTSVPDSLLPHADRQESFVTPDPEAAPAVQVALAEVALAGRRVEVERSLGRPNASVSAGIRRFQDERTFALVAGVSVPLPLFDQNVGAIAAARAAETAAEARLQQARLDAAAEVRSALARAEAAQSRLTAAREAERVAAEAARLAGVGYRLGRLSLMELLTARRTLAAARTLTIDARLERLSAEAALARLAGLVPFGDQP